MQQKEGSDKSWDKPPTLAAQNAQMEIKINKHSNTSTDDDWCNNLPLTNNKALGSLELYVECTMKPH